LNKETILEPNTSKSEQQRRIAENCCCD